MESWVLDILRVGSHRDHLGMNLFATPSAIALLLSDDPRTKGTIVI